MKRIFVDTPTWFYSRRNTDWVLKQNLAKGLAEFGVVLRPGVWWNVVYNLLYVGQRLPLGPISRWIKRIAPGVRARLVEHYHPDVFITQGEDPPIPTRCKIIWETYFLTDGTNTEFKRGGKAHWIRQMEAYGSQVSIIAVRGMASVELVKSMYPEYADKVRNLLFIKPEYDIVSEDFVREKQSTDGTVRLLFVGREAYRKGLDAVLAACETLYASGVLNFHLTIVSNLHNCSIEIPNVAWLTHYRELPHVEVMKLMREAQIFIMPSRSESYGLVYHEAMANGCVTFVRNGEPQREFVDYGRAGVCVSSNDIKGIFEEVSRCISDKMLRISLALSGLVLYQEKFCQFAITRAWREAIEE